MSDTTAISLAITIAAGLGLVILTCGGGWVGLGLYILVIALIFGFAG